MNIFKHEIKSYIKSLTWWSIGMFLLIFSSMSKFETLQSSGQSVNQIMETFPKSIQVIFGINGVDLSKASSYFGTIFLYMLITAGIHAALLGSDIIAKEERDKTSEFLFIKPLTRKQILWQKVLAGTTIVVLFNIITSILSVLIMNKYSNEGNLTAKIMPLMLGLLFVQFIFLSLGLMSGAFTKKTKTAATIPVTVLLSSYLLLIVIALIPNLEFLKYISPLNYFDAQSIIKGDSFPLNSVVISIVIILFSISQTFHFFKVKDLG
jgi:ABC-2 type transport system permease protein